MNKPRIFVILFLLFGMLSPLAQFIKCDECEIIKTHKKHRKIYTELSIDAPKELVWKVLINFETMPKWSSGLQGLEGKLKNGEEIIAVLKTQKVN